VLRYTVFIGSALVWLDGMVSLSVMVAVVGSGNIKISTIGSSRTMAFQVSYILLVSMSLESRYK